MYECVWIARYVVLGMCICAVSFIHGEGLSFSIKLADWRTRSFRRKDGKCVRARKWKKKKEAVSLLRKERRTSLSNGRQP